MNGTQTRTAGTRAAQLTKQVEDLATILEEIDQRLLDLAAIVEQIDKRQVAITKGTADAYDALSQRVDQIAATEKIAELEIKSVDQAVFELRFDVGQLQQTIADHTGRLDARDVRERKALARTPIGFVERVAYLLRWLFTGRT